MSWSKSTKASRVPTPNFHDANCPTRSILDDVMSRWGSLVLVSLLDRSYRFSELAYLIGGVSEKMLSQTLRRLEVDGLVWREVHATKPPKVEYSLTPLGHDLSQQVRSLVTFVQAHAEEILKHRARAEKRRRVLIINKS